MTDQVVDDIQSRLDNLLQDKDPTLVAKTNVAHHVAAAELDVNKIRDFVDTLAEGNDWSPAEISALYWATQAVYDYFDEVRKKLYHTLNLLDKAVCPQVFERAEVDLIRIPELGRSFYVKQNMSVSMRDKEKGMEWVRSQGQGDMITQTINAGTLTNYLRKCIEKDNIDPPQDVFEIKTYQSIGSSKYTPKKA